VQGTYAAGFMQKIEKKTAHCHVPLNPKMQMRDKQSLNKNSCSHPGHVRWIPTIKYN
jgi:hypothetical protein